MLCSIRTGKSGSNWLDRLRSTKGFPAADHLDLDHFLSNPEPSSDSPPTTTAAAADASISESSASAIPSQLGLPNQNQNSNSTRNGEWYGVMSNVLSELFNMDGDPNQLPKFSGKKSSRKQTNPKICVAQVSNCDKEGVRRKDENAPAAAVSLGSDNNSVEVKEESVDAEPEEVEERGDKELFGYSRSEVTVIDTSCPAWKFEKLVFRRKNVWKVRDKKGKPRSFLGRKKRKWNGGCDDENAGHYQNKKVKEVSGDQESLLTPSNYEGQNPQNEKMEETSIERPDDICQVPRKKISSSRSPRKSRKGGSSVVLIKGIPTSKKSGVKLPSNCLKNARTQQEA